jgi:anti-sigma factor RsiW
VRCEHEHDDGAYVLGALSPAERVAYERHIATCSFCREAVADMSALPDLLNRLDAREFAKLVEPGALGVPTVPRRRGWRVRALSSATALVFVALIAFGVLAWTRDTAPPSAPPPGPAVAMTPVDGVSPITATLRLTTTAGGTRVDMVCAYSASAPGPYTFRLIAYGPDDQKEQLGSWQAAPGTDFSMPAVTHFAGGSLDRLELVRYDGKALLAYDVP